MSKKLTVTAVILLSLGIVMVPGGFIVNNFIQDLTYSSVDQGLLGIKDQGIPIVKESTLELGPEALALTFDLLVEQGMKYSKPIVDSTFFMNQIYTIESQGSGLAQIVESLFFDENQPVSSLLGILNYPEIKGISEWANVALNFTTHNPATKDDTWGGIERLKFGVNTTGKGMWWGDRLPGFYEDTYNRLGDAYWPPENNYSDVLTKVDVNQDRGFGVIDMMNLIKSATDNNQILDLAGENGYNLTDPDDVIMHDGKGYNKLEILYLYYTEYFTKDVVDLIVPKFNQPTASSADNPVFYAYPQYELRDWNGYNTSYEDIQYYSFIEQWAKCNDFDNGFEFHNAQPSIPAGIYGLEPGGPGNSSGIPIQAAFQLWNKSNEDSFVNIDGIYKWYNASTDISTYNELLNEFSKYPGYNDTYWNENNTYSTSDWGFNETDMDLILDWLWGNGGKWNQGSFYEVTLPKLITNEVAFQILLEQWAYGTIRGVELYPGGFPLPLGSNIVYGFELGFQGPGQHVIPADMSINTALALWDTSNEYSLTKKSGLTLWFAAVNGDSNTYSKLQSKFDLTEHDMYLLLNWLPDFQHNVMPTLAQFQYSLPMDSITLSNIVEVAFVGIGAVCIGLGAMGMGGYIATRKTKTYNPKKKLDPFELGSKTKK